VFRLRLASDGSDDDDDERSANIQRAAGAALATTLLSAGVLAASVWTVRCLYQRHGRDPSTTPSSSSAVPSSSDGHEDRRQESGWGKAVGALYALVLAFYGPNTTQLAVEVNVIADGSGGIAPPVIAVVSVAVQLVLLAPAVHAIVRPPPAIHGGGGDRRAAVHHALYAFVSPLAATARTTADRVVRVVALEDIAFAHCIAFIAGLRPRDRPTCSALIATIAVLTVLHLAYLVIVKPYASRAELAFALIVAVGIAAQVVAALFVLYDRAQPAALGAVGVALDVVFFVQLGVLAGIEIWWAVRRRCKDDHDERLHDGPISAVDVPLLLVPAAAGPAASHPPSQDDGGASAITAPHPLPAAAAANPLRSTQPVRQ